MGGETIGEAFVAIRPETAGFSTELQSGLKGAMKGLGVTLGAVFAASKAKEFFDSIISEATESQKVAAQTAAVLKSTGQAAHVSASQVDELSNAISKKVGIDDEAIASAENVLLTFRDVRNETGKGNDIFNQATKAIVDVSVALKQDLQTSAIQVGKALQDPVAGVTALRRVGVQLNDQQEASIKTFVAQGDVMAAQKVILKELNAEFKGSAEAQATPAEKANVAWKNLEETLGKLVLPVIQKVTDALIPLVTYLSEHRDLALALAAVVGGVLTAAFVAWTASLFAAGGALALLLSPAALIAAAVLAIAAAVYFLWTNWDQVWGWIQNHPAYAAVVALISLPLATFVLLIGGLKELYTNWDSIWGAIESTTAAAAAFIIGVIDDVKQAIRDLTGLVSGSGSFGEDVDRARALQRSFANAPTFTAPGPYGFASGGRVPGYGNTDSVPAMLTPGEFVVKADGSNLPRGGLFDGATVVIGDTGVISDLDYWQRTRMAGV